MSDADVTSIRIKGGFRTYEPSTRNSVEVFNELSPAPGVIDLGDGRVLELTSWHPSCTIDCSAGIVRVSLDGYIKKKE